MRSGRLTRLWTSTQPFQRPALALVGALVVLLLSAGPAVAQTPTAPASPTPTVTTRPLYFEVMLVVVMIGVSLYVVCRSSRRN